MEHGALCDGAFQMMVYLRCFFGSVTFTASLSAAALSDLMGYPAQSCPAGGSQSHVNLCSTPLLSHVISCRRYACGVAVAAGASLISSASDRILMRAGGYASPERSALELPKVQEVSPELIVGSILLQICVEAPVIGKVKAAGPAFVHHGHQRQLDLINVWKHRAQQLGVSR